MTVTSATRLVALLGWPVRHSLSPLMHNTAFAEQGLDLVYLALPTPPDELETVVRALGAMEAVGANVTVPHKEAVARCCDRRTAEAELVGAVNTLVWASEGLVGDNTDAGGLEQVLRDDIGVEAGGEAVVLGTGGAARAAAVAFARVGCGVAFVGRRGDAAEDVARLAATCGAPAVGGIALDDDQGVRAAIADANVVVNATPLGMDGETLPEPFHALHAGQVALDLVYRPPDTPFLVAAREAGAEAHHGLGMLIGQAAASYRRWTGQEAPAAIMSAAAVAALTDGA